MARAIVAFLLWLARHDPVPDIADAWAARSAIMSIRFYQRHLSRGSGRICLFVPTCSARAAAAFERLGWKLGLQETAAQLGRCGGTYSLLRTAQGQVMLIAHDGSRFEADQLSAAVLGHADPA